MSEVEVAQADRRDAIEDLIKLQIPVGDAVAAVQRFGWDSEEELVLLGPGELRNALTLFLDGELDAATLEDWANAVEGRDDVRFDSQVVIDLLFEVANPELFRPLTVESVEDIIRRIS